MITRRRLSGASSGYEPHGQLSFGESSLISAGGSGFAGEFEERWRPLGQEIHAYLLDLGGVPPAWPLANSYQ